MAHVGQESALRPTGRFGGLLGFHQLGRSRFNERGEMVAVLRELFFGALAFGNVA